MASVVIFTLNKPAVVLDSVNTPEYENRIDCLINPNLTTVRNVNKLYWKRSFSNVVEMSAFEKQVVDTTLANEKEAATQAFADLSVQELAKALVQLNSQGKPTTKTNLVAAIKAVR